MKNRKPWIRYNPELKHLARQLRNNSTKSEIHLWQYLKGKRCYGYDFHRQKPAGNYILDFFCHELMLGIELDGYTHIFHAEVHQKDLIKEAALNAMGITILRFKDEQVLNDIQNVLRCIENYILLYKETHP